MDIHDVSTPTSFNTVAFMSCELVSINNGKFSNITHDNTMIYGGVFYFEKALLIIMKNLEFTDLIY